MSNTVDYSLFCITESYFFIFLAIFPSILSHCGAQNLLKHIPLHPVISSYSIQHFKVIAFLRTSFPHQDDNGPPVQVRPFFFSLPLLTTLFIAILVSLASCYTVYERGEFLSGWGGGLVCFGFHQFGIFFYSAWSMEIPLGISKACVNIWVVRSRSLLRYGIVVGF